MSSSGLYRNFRLGKGKLPSLLGKSSPLKLPFKLPLLPPFPPPPTPTPFSTGITAAIFHTSFNALAFNVATPRRATIPTTTKTAAAVRVIISPADRTLTAELTTEARCSRSAPIPSAASTHCAATSAAADATAMSVFAVCSSFRDPDEAAVAAAIAATAAATPATDTAA
ncbi:hypothetical protein RJ639_001326 [Escallonia herrerae]|uniref:Uncharacterized protein n=1 Tax=Escallonia herrerae TaxID=1293975 RepID=A0AA88X9R1_9ASTE|nr:hypothetical protein RJ639_001326 [Escallonia herrerae]